MFRAPSRRALLALMAAAPCAPLGSLSAAPAGFPRTVTHRLGETRLPAPPRRVVSAGYHEQDFLYALGIAPVGVHDWFGEKPFATWPWAEGARRALGAQPAVQAGFEIDAEWVHAQAPDLIVASFFGLDRATYDLLSQIAPVIAAPAEYPLWGAPWEAELRLIARAVGREDAAEAVIAELADAVARVRAGHPGFAGKTATVGHFAADHFVGYRSEDGGNRLLKQLGFRQPDVFDELAGDDGALRISPERVDLFDLDAVVWLVDAAARARIEGMPLYRIMDLAREGRGVWADELLTGAMSFQSPLSLHYVLEELPPLLETALDGDPSTLPPD